MTYYFDSAFVVCYYVTLMFANYFEFQVGFTDEKIPLVNFHDLEMHRLCASAEYRLKSASQQCMIMSFPRESESFYKKKQQIPHEAILENGKNNIIYL